MDKKETELDVLRDIRELLAQLVDTPVANSGGTPPPPPPGGHN